MTSYRAPLKKSSSHLKSQPSISVLEKSRRPFLMTLLVGISLVISFSVFCINRHVRVVDIGYKIDRELRQKQSLIEANKQIKLEIAQLKSPTRIEKFARENLKLSTPERRQLVYLSQIETSDFYRLAMQPRQAARPEAVLALKTAPKAKELPAVATTQAKAQLSVKKNAPLVALAKKSDKDKIEKPNSKPVPAKALLASRTAGQTAITVAKASPPVPPVQKSAPATAVLSDAISFKPVKPQTRFVLARAETEKTSLGSAGNLSKGLSVRGEKTNRKSVPAIIDPTP